MSIPSLTRKQSSFSALIEQERKLSGQDSTRNDEQQEVQAANPGQPQTAAIVIDEEAGDTDVEGGDTDIEEDETESGDVVPSLPPTLSKQKTLILKENEVQNVSSLPLQRASSRLMSMKRKGKVVLLREMTNEFEYNAGDILTVRGEEDDFYVCRVLEDVPLMSESFLVAWYNRIGPNVYEASFDDMCYMNCVITRVSLIEKDGQFSLPEKSIKKTKRLLREALAEERGEEIEPNDEDEDDEEDDEEPPPAKRTRSSGGTPTPLAKRGKKGKQAKVKQTTPKKGKAQKRKAPTPKKQKKEKPEKKKGRRAGALIPNPAIELVDVDPTFETREDVGLMPCKQSIRAVRLNDMKLLKTLIDDVKQVHTVHWPQSPDVHNFAIHHALLNNNKEAVEMLLDDILDPKKKRCGPPQVTLDKMDTGSYNFHTFGHAVRQLYASRGSRQGNNAFLKDRETTKHILDSNCLLDNLLSICLKNENVSMEMLHLLIEKGTKNKRINVDIEDVIENIWKAIRSGNRKVAGYLVKTAVDKEGFGFNFLHKEVLLNDSEPLSKFRSPSVKKQPYMNKKILPLHAACINPNKQYLKDLLNVIPEYNVPDKEGYKMIHYACACEGPGPLKLLLSRGVDSNDLAPKGITPLMIAAKYGRDENIEALLASKTPVDDDNDDNDDDDTPAPRVIIDIKSKSEKAAIHYAASGGHVSIIKALVSHGSNINLQTGSNKGNLTALMQGAKNGNLDVVTTCVELGAKPDLRGKWKMTALMYAVKNGHSKVAAYLLRLGVDPNAIDTSGNTPVHYAAAYGWLHCLKLLVKAGAHINVVNQWKTTALALSMMKDHLMCSEYLLSLEDCDVNFPDDNGLTLLSQTIKNLQLNKKMMTRVSYLVEEKNADVKTVDTNGWTPLHHLAANSVYIPPKNMPGLAWLAVGCKEPEKTTTKSQDDVQQMETQTSGDDNHDNDDDDNHDDNHDNDDHDHDDNDDDDDDDNDDDDDDDNDDDDDDDDHDDHDDHDDESDSECESDRCFNFKKCIARTIGLYRGQWNYLNTPPHLVGKFVRVSSAVVDILVKAGADVNAVDREGQTPMMLAVLQHNYPLIHKLIELGAKPTVGQNKAGQQVVHLQAEKQNYCDLRQMYPDVTEPPLSGTIEEQLKQREAFLKILVQKANVEMLELFIGSGAEISATDSNGVTPLIIACKASNLEMFEVLLDHKADPSMGLEIKTGRNLLHFMATVDYKSRGRLASKLTQVMDDSGRKGVANTVDNNGFTPLLLACEDYASSSHSEDKDCEKVRSEYFKILVEEFGCDVTASVGKFKKGDKIERPTINTFGIELNDIYKMDYVETGNFTCLHFLSYLNDPSSPPLTIQLLLRHLHGNSDVINSRDLLGRTPLHCAVIRKNKKCVEELVRNGADVNLVTQEKEEKEEKQHFSTPLILACKPTLSVDIATCLLNWKANPNLVDKNGRSALSHAVTNAPDSDGSSVEVVGALLEAGAAVNSVDHKGLSVLHFAVNTTTGGFETLSDVEDLLLKNGADTTKRDSMGRLPLHYAFVKIGCDSDKSLSDPVTISSLIANAMQEQTVDMKTLINQADNNRQTALHRAAIRGATLCMLHLVKNGAYINIQDNDGNTPFSLAIRGGHNSCAVSLIQQGASPTCDVITPVTKQQLEDYEKEKEKAKWIWKELHNLKVPQSIIKSAFYEIVQHNWQGVAYLMLEVAGLEFILAIEAVLAAKKIDLAWTLLRKQKKDACVQGVDETGRNVLHLLALHVDTYNDVVNKIAVHVLQRGVSPSSVDKQGAIPLHYAACNGNQGLCELLLRYNPSTINSVLANQSGMTPFACCFDSNDLTSRHKLIESMIKSKPKTLDVCYKVGEGEVQETTTPLIEACMCEDEFLLKLLLDNNTGVNCPKANGRTPLMEVVRANLEGVANILLYGTTDREKWKDSKTDVDLTAVDNDGRTVVHHCVQNRQYGSSENVDLLMLLGKLGAPLEVHDNSGRTPLDYAKRQQSGRMKEALLDLIGDNDSTEDDTETMETDEDAHVFSEFWEGPEPDIDADSEAMLVEAKTGDELPDWDPSKPPPVDRKARVENGEVYVNPDTGIPYDILMSKVDTKYGMFGLNNFYKMQVVHQKGKDLWVLVNRWGRIGDCGQHQRTPFGNNEEATKEFRKIFRSKTGNDWNDKDNFKKMPKKYALVLPERNPEFKRKKAAEILKPFDLKKCPPSKLPKEMQNLMEALTDVDSMRDAMDHLDSVSIDHDYMPFGRLSLTTISEAKDILLQIKDIISEIDGLKGSEPKYEQIVELSNSYFMLIPMANYTFEKMRPLNQEHDVDRHLNSLVKLTELAFVSKLLLAAQYRSKDVNPLDYCYRALGSHVEVLDHTSDECQLILKTIHNTSDDNQRNEPEVKAVYRVSRPIEKERMTSCGVHSNHRLLWHGTKTAHVMGILKEGLRIAPPEAVTTGWMLGKGIYFSDTLKKSMQYSNINQWGYTGPGFALLCQVALGEQHEFTKELGDDITSPPPNYNSIWRVSKNVPDPTHDVTTPYGATLPTGSIVTLENKYSQDKQFCFSYDSEFVVYNEAQVQQKYLVQFETK